MKFKSEIVTQVSGSIGGTTYSHNRGGMYRRARAIPTNPNSAAQQAVRSIFSSLSTAWAQILTQAQRDLWSTYAANNPITDTLGDPLLLTGQQMYIRCNSVRMRASLASIPAGPTAMGLAMLTPPTMTALLSSDELIATFVAGDPWEDEPTGAFLMFGSRQQAPSVNFLRSPMRFFGFVIGDATTAPTSLQKLNPFGDDYVAGNIVFSRVVVVRADGRISGSQRFRTTII